MNYLVQKRNILNLFLKYCIFFGYYHNDTSCGFKKFLLKVMPVLIGAAILYIEIFCCLSKNSDSILFIKVFQYIVYYICALTTGSGYLLDYFNTDIFDDNLYSRKIYNKIYRFIIQYNIFLHIFYMIFSWLYYLTENYACNGSWVHFSVQIYFHIALELGFMPVIFTLFLFYLRTSFLCTSIREEDAHISTTFNWKKYVKIYIKHIESLEKTDWPVKLMIFIQLIISFYDISKAQFYIVLLYKNDALKYSTTLNISVMITYILYKYIKVFCPAIIMELVLKQMDTLKIELADKMITCPDMRRKEQLREMLKRFHSRPLTLTLWRTLRIDSSLALGFLSLMATCLVCLLQFSHVLEH